MKLKYVFLLSSLMIIFISVSNVKSVKLGSADGTSLLNANSANGTGQFGDSKM